MYNAYLMYTCNPVFVFTAWWLESWQRSMESGGAQQPIAVFWNPWELRNRWLECLTRLMDSYMRSPAFLELMQYSLKTITTPNSSVI